MQSLLDCSVRFIDTICMMNKETKEQVIERLTKKLGRAPYSYEISAQFIVRRPRYRKLNSTPEVGTVGMGHPRMFATHATS